MRTLLDMVIEGDPVPKARPRSGRNGHTYTPQRTRDAEKVIRDLAAELVDEPYDGPVAISCHFECATARRTDGDNLMKLVWDALNGVVYVDDSQIRLWYGGLVRKSPTPQTRVLVYTVESKEA